MRNAKRTAKIFAGLTAWPRIQISKSVRPHHAGGIDEARSRIQIQIRVGPPEKWMAHCRRVSQDHVLFERRVSIAQDEFRDPLHPVNTISVSQPDFGVIFFLTDHKAYGRNAIEPMSNRKVK